VFTTWPFTETILISINLIAMWKQFVKDYLRFTKKDRVGILVLISLIFLVLLLPYIWPVKKPLQPSAETIASIKAQSAELNKLNENGASSINKENDSGRQHYHAKESYYTNGHTLFYFDPNTLDARGWQQLGIREKTALTIVKYIGRGGKFRQPEDIGKIYGLSPKDYARLLPFVKIDANRSGGTPDRGISQQSGEKPSPNEKKTSTGTDKPGYRLKNYTAAGVSDINQADTAAFIALPGIGSKLAARIIAFREKLGGFYSVQQVAETYGLPDSTFNKIQPLLQCNHPVVRQININTADANTLKQHPYIRWNLANAIVQYRAQHGNFKSAEDLQQIALITPGLFEKLKVYLVTGQ
jgi:competence protein ComEA